MEQEYSPIFDQPETINYLEKVYLSIDPEIFQGVPCDNATFLADIPEHLQGKYGMLLLKLKGKKSPPTGSSQNPPHDGIIHLVDGVWKAHYANLKEMLEWSPLSDLNKSTP